MAARRLTLSLSLVLGTGCATTPVNRTGGSADFDRTLVEVRAQNAGFVRQIDEMQNKILMLEDALESRRVSDERERERPHLFSRRIGVPQALPPPPPAPAQRREIASESCVAEDATVEYAGEAALPVRRERERTYARPVLRLSGTGNVASMSVVESTPAEPAADISLALQLYRRSMVALRTGHVAKAITGFRKFLAHYPHNHYADNAQFGIAEGYYDMKQFRTAAVEYRRVVERYPHGNKVPESMLKLGLSQLALGERNEARRMLETLRRTYPRKPAARAAAEHLAQATEDAAAPTVSLDLQRR